MVTLAGLWDALRFGDTKNPLVIKIDPGHVEPRGALPEPHRQPPASPEPRPPRPPPPGEIFQPAQPRLIVPRRDYFQVIINQLFLSHGREWFVDIEPMVLAVSEFKHAGTDSTVPYVLGPGKLKQYGIGEPRGMVYENIRVAGLHPYAGGTVGLAVVLCQVPRDNVADKFLSVVETTSHALSFDAAVLPYVKIGRAVAEGVTALFGLKGTKSLLGWKQEFDHDRIDRFSPGYFALIGDPAPDPLEVWVAGGKLMVGRTLAQAKEWRDSDFVLFSTSSPPDSVRSDLDQLPFQPLWERVQKEAFITTEEGRKSLEANWTALSQAIALSPDLTDPQRELLEEEYFQKATKLRESARKREFRSGGAVDPDEAIRARSLRGFGG